MHKTVCLCISILVFTAAVLPIMMFKLVTPCNLRGRNRRFISFMIMNIISEIGTKLSRNYGSVVLCLGWQVRWQWAAPKPESVKLLLVLTVINALWRKCLHFLSVKRMSKEQLRFYLWEEGQQTPPAVCVLFRNSCRGCNDTCLCFESEKGES
jgi:hypothetical protein